MTHFDQLFGQPVYEAFGAAVELRRHGLGQWRDLSDAHLRFFDLVRSAYMDMPAFRTSTMGQQLAVLAGVLRR